MLWQELQKQFSIDGRLRVSSIDDADAYLRAQIVSASLRQTHDLEVSDPKYPKTLYNKSGKPYGFSNFPNLNQAHTVMKNQDLSAQILIEIWDLRQRTKLFEKVYKLDQSTPILNGLIDIDRQFVNQFINAQEAFDSSFSAQSELLAKAVVLDFFRQTNR